MNGEMVTLHGNHVGRAPLVRLLIFCAPSSNGVAKVAALVLHLRVIAHLSGR